MPNVQWNDIPFGLSTPGGNLLFNQQLPADNPVSHTNSVLGPQWLLEQDKCFAGAAKRVARDNAPQKPGEIIHKKYRTGLVCQLGALAVNMLADGEMEPACGEDLVDLYDGLLRSLQSIENTEGQLLWVPTNKAARLMDACRWLGPDGGGGGGFQSVSTSVEDTLFTAVTFALLSPFPYAMDATQIPTALDPGGVAATNNGTSSFYPVIQVSGPTAAFTIQVDNALTGETLFMVYDSTLPGAHAIAGGDYVEFDFFRETAYLNGDGANRKSGIDIFSSDFWTLTPGANTVYCDATATMLWQSAWTG